MNPCFVKLIIRTLDQGVQKKISSRTFYSWSFSNIHAFMCFLRKIGENIISIDWVKVGIVYYFFGNQISILRKILSLCLQLFSNGIANNFVPVNFGSCNGELSSQGLKSSIGHSLIIFWDGRLVFRFAIFHQLNYFTCQLFVRL